MKQYQDDLAKQASDPRADELAFDVWNPLTKAKGDSGMAGGEQAKPGPPPPSNVKAA